MKVLALDRNHKVLNDGLRDFGFTVDEDYDSTKKEILKVIDNYDGIIIRSRLPIDREFLEHAVNLKFIGRVGAGLENIDMDYAEERGIAVFNAPEGNRDSVGEHAVGMLLELVHRLNIADTQVRKGIWDREGNRGDEILGKTVGLIGYGNMGKAFAKRLQGFGVDVICYDIKDGVGDEFAVQVSKEELFRRTDILSLHTPQTPLTMKMVNKEFIDSFHKNFYLINTARGKSVVTADLVEALKSGKVKGAALDVHEYEKTSFERLNTDEFPEPFVYLIQSEKVVLAPHVAGWTHQSKVRLAEVIVKKIADWKKSHNIAK